LTAASRFEVVGAAARRGSYTLDWRVDLIGPTSDELLVSDRSDAGVLQWGATLRPVVVTNDRVSARSITLTVPVTDQALVPTVPGSLLHPATRNRVRVSLGIEGADGVWSWWTVATMLVAEVIGQVDGDVTVLDVALVDPTRPINSDTESSVTFAADTAVEDAVTRLLGDVLDPGSFVVGSTGHTVQALSFEAGENRLELVTQMLEGCGHELTTTPAGLVITRPIPPSGDDPVLQRWSYGGPAGIPIARLSRVWSLASPQGVKVVSGSSDPGTVGLSTIVWDRDPTSQGFMAGPGEVTVREVRYPFARSVAQLVAAGYGQLRRHSLGPVTVELWTTPNPAMAEGDLIEVEHPALGVAHTMRVLGFDLPVHVDGLMRIRARAVFDPAVDLGATPPPNALPQFTDDFQRPDQNLEDKGEGGSPNWVEVGWSWGVVGGRAIARLDKSWTLGLVNGPVQAADAYAEIAIAAIPSGRFVGPAVRCSGPPTQDGYVALADSAGRVSLEMWVAGRNQATLATYNYGGSLAGHSLRVEADGQTVRVKVDGATVATVTDDRRTGGWVGMLAYGGPATAAPAVESFDAGEL
jgi:hypothetical protein